MERPTDRDLDRLLEGALPGTLGPASAACVDAEQLAVWADGGLTDEERARIDAHVAGCERCLAMTAMFMRAEREAPPAAVMTSVPLAKVVPIRRPWARPVWLAPLAAAAAVTMWFVWPRPDGSVLDRENAKPATEVARLEPAPTMPLPPSSTLSQQQGQSSPSTAAADAAKLTETKPIAGAGEVGNAFRDRALPEGSARQDTQGKDARAKRETQAGAAPVPAPSVVAPAATSPSAPPVQTTTGAAAPAQLPARPLPAPPPPVAAPAAETRLQQLGAADAAAANRVAGGIVPARPVLEIVTITVALADQPAGSGNTAGAGRGGGGGGRGAGFSAATGTSPRWRVLDEIRVERSADEGLSWQPLSISLPAGTTIVSGTSPAPGVCWLVGRRGLVLVSTNGTRFDIVTAPADVDLASIRATSARSASVTTADGRVFVTSDGGQTWRLQGFPAGPF